MGSSRGVWGAGKARVAKLNYAPYGEREAVLGDAPGLQYTGKVWDAESGLYYFPFRMYSPSFKRWLTRDPLGMVDGPNVYAYVAGNPVSSVDRLGLVATAAVLMFILLILGGVYALTSGACMSRVVTETQNVRGQTTSFRHCVVTCRWQTECGISRGLAGALNEFNEIYRVDVDNWSIEFIPEEDRSPDWENDVLAGCDGARIDLYPTWLSWCGFGESTTCIEECQNQGW